MAIFKYKKPNGSGGYSIEEMPVISNTYTEYVVKDATDGTKTITLTPLHTSESTGAGAFEDVVASVKLLNTDPTYAPSTSQQIITYDGNGFPKKITISAIPTTTKTYISSATKQEYNFTTSTGFPTKVTINAIPSNGNKTITLSPGTLSSSLDPGYYGTISTSVKTYSTNPSYTPSTSAQNITYTASTGFPKGITISAIPTTTLTLKNNNTTYNIGSGSWTAGTYPTSITVQVPSDLPSPSSPPSTTTITTQNGSITINAGYYTENFDITAQFPAITTSGTVNLKPKTKTSQSVSIGYYSNGFTVSPSTQTLTAANPSLTYNSSTGYYEKSYEPTTSTSSSTVWGDKYLTKFTLQFTNQSPSSQSLTPSKSSFTIPTGYHATSNRTVSVSSGSKSITSNGTYYASDDGYYYSSVTVDVQGITLADIEDDKEATTSMILSGYKAYNDKGTLIIGSMIDGGTRSITSNGTYTTAGSGYYYSSVNVDVSITLASGTLGTYNSISWRVYRDGTLVVDGSGAIPSYSPWQAPWNNWASSINSILIGDGIYEIGEYGFAFLYDVTQISISNSVHNIGQNAFWRTGENCTALNIYLPASIYSIGSGAFGWGSNSNNSIWEVRFTGNVPSGTISTQAFSSPIQLCAVPWSSSVKTTTSMCSYSIASSLYNYNAQTDNGSYM